MAERIRLVSLISGGGSTMEAIARACDTGVIPNTNLVAVIANHPSAGGLEKAQRMGIPTRVIDPRNHTLPNGKRDQIGFGEALCSAFVDLGTTIVTQNGWLVRTPPNAIWRNHLNQHPAPTEFGGKGMFGRAPHEAVLIFHDLARTEDPMTQVIAQHVAPEYDEGDVVGYEEVPVMPGETAEELQAWALSAEHRVQKEALRDFAHGELVVVKRTLFVRPDQRELVDRAKELAITRYPKG